MLSVVAAFAPNAARISLSVSGQTRPALLEPDNDAAVLGAFHAEPKSAKEATIIAFEFGRMLRISRDLLANAATKLGLWELLRLEDRMARQIGSILNPDAYLLAAASGTELPGADVQPRIRLDAEQACCRHGAAATGSVDFRLYSGLLPAGRDETLQSLGWQSRSP
ncbi:hypothetical protein [Paracoccus mutanolyticus]|uniref:hypothetical protein n=1 Tax=Paracoccus mutanolyticus TaxID=1499308 RepID=UPI0011AE264E|nr:hypothetical protein [Paracoccus mutanolyticus]